MSDAIERLTAERRGNAPNLRPKDAATLIIIDRTGPAPKVLLGKRHEAHTFMPGRFVFPGGRVEKSDRLMPAAQELDPRVEARLRVRSGRASAVKPRALALAAVRETFEETGLMLGRKLDKPLAAPGGLWSAFAEARISPDLSTMHFVARAVTPPGQPRRFDTRFFAVDAALIARRIDGIVGPQAELIELVWTSIAETRHLGLHPITTVILEELEARAAAGMTHDLPVPFYRRLNDLLARELL
jgi:8-oxo-dGTP pyrophosphatase MutT (NUDIX family)